MAIDYAVDDGIGFITLNRPPANAYDSAMVGELPAIVPEIEGEAHITGEHTFYLDPRDPFVAGFRL